MPIPVPYVGLVINYNYLWKDDAINGRETGAYARPACIISAMRQENDGKIMVLVVPITHSPKTIVDGALKVPTEVKKHIGLDDRDSWVVCSEVNKFIWPGYDIVPIAKSKAGEYVYGTITRGFLTAIKTKILTLRNGKELKIISRNAAES